YYCPETGRWITPDPAGFTDGPNLYAYVQNNPLTLFDPYGLSLFEDQMTADRETYADAYREQYVEARAQADTLVREHNIRMERERFCNEVAAFTASFHQFT